MGAGAIAGLALGGMGLMARHHANKKQQQAARDANRMAEAAAAERQREIERDKAEAQKERRQYVDDMRAQLGVGLNIGDTVGTKFKKKTMQTMPSSTLG